MYFSQLSVFGLIDSEVDNVKREDILAGFVDDVFMDELLGDEVLVVDEEGVELGRHCFSLLVQRD